MKFAELLSFHSSFLCGTVMAPAAGHRLHEALFANRIRLTCVRTGIATGSRRQKPLVKFASLAEPKRQAASLLPESRGHPLVGIEYMCVLAKRTTV